MAGWPPLVAVLGLALVCRGRATPLTQEVPGGMVQKINSSCSSQDDCQQVTHGVCNITLGTCQCIKTHPIPNEITCLKASAVNESCSITAQCRPDLTHAECVRGICVCGAEYYIHTYTDGTSSCLLRSGESKKTPVDPVMIGILASLVLMFVIICVVLRLFSKAQFRQTRTILNSANPRLMNASFLKGSIIKSPVDQLRGSRGSRSSRGSRAPSMTSLQRAGGQAAPENGTPAPSATPTTAVAQPELPSTGTIRQT